MKIALVHDFLTKMGGAENVLYKFHELYPDAPIYTLLYDEKGTKGVFKECNIVTSSLQKLPRFLRRPRFLFSRLAAAIEEFDFSGFDVVISSSNAFAHGVITPPSTFHLSYCHSPMRYVWDWHSEYLKENNITFNLKGLYVRALIHQIRIWDRLSADRVDCFVANSENVRKRIQKYYREDSIVVYPPVETDAIQPSNKPPRDFYLIVSRLEPYKNIRLAVEAFNQLGKELIVIGEGSELASLKEIAKDNVKLLGWQPNDKVTEHLMNAKAFIFAGEDDFGITPVESMAAGRPVIALRRGGVMETVVDGKTGLFFDQPTIDSLTEAVNRLEEKYSDFKVETCRDQAEKFSCSSFKKNFQTTLLLQYKKYGEKFLK